ncbi:MAG: NAD(P)/FAD-dependent oxidoreductase [Pseudomonadota bacterium]
MGEFDVIVIGGGAAGLMCASVAGKRGRRVVVLEGSNKVGKKILMSGGGRCNFTNLYCEPANFLSQNPRFCISALHRYTQWDFLDLVNHHGIAWHEKADGQLFCDNSSKDIVAMLLAECDDAGVTIFTHSAVESVARTGRFVVESAHGTFVAQSLVIATGGLSIPKMGASDFGYRLARQFGLDVLPTRAGLVPFVFSGATKELTGRLSGVSVPARLSTTEMAFANDMLFTHRGLSGPAALQLSSYWHEGEDIAADLTPDAANSVDLLALKTSQPRALLRTVLSEHLPRALVLELQALFWPEHAEMPLGELSNETLRRIGERLREWRLRPAGTEGYRTAEVTLGGIDTRALSSRTMEVTSQPGLFCIGEVVDVTGHLGGFNFQWAWASAQAAAQCV